MPPPSSLFGCGSAGVCAGPPRAPQELGLQAKMTGPLCGPDVGLQASVREVIMGDHAHKSVLRSTAMGFQALPSCCAPKGAW